MVKSRPRENENIRYYEFDIDQKDPEGDPVQKGKELNCLNIKDITKLIKSLEKIKDQVYYNAIENNFSHELMTPLNPIIASVESLKNDMLKIYSVNNDIPPRGINEVEVHNFDLLSPIIQNDETCTLLRNLINIEQASSNMWYFISN